MFGMFQFLLMTVIYMSVLSHFHEEGRSSRPTDAEVCVPLVYNHTGFGMYIFRCYVRYFCVPHAPLVFFVFVFVLFFLSFFLGCMYVLFFLSFFLGCMYVLFFLSFFLGCMYVLFFLSWVYVCFVFSFFLSWVYVCFVFVLYRQGAVSNIRRYLCTYCIHRRILGSPVPPSPPPPPPPTLIIVCSRAISS